MALRAPGDNKLITAILLVINNNNDDNDNNNNLKFIERQDYRIFKGAKLYINNITLQKQRNILQ